HANWKRKVFLGSEPGVTPDKPPLDLFLESPQLLALAGQFGVTPTQLVNLQNLVANARSLAGGTTTKSVAPDAESRATAAPVAAHFFKWLRQQVLDACERLNLDGLDPDRIPTRIT